MVTELNPMYDFCCEKMPRCYVFRMESRPPTKGCVTRWSYIKTLDDDEFDPNEWPRDHNGQPMALVSVMPDIDPFIGKIVRVATSRGVCGQLGRMEFDDFEGYSLVGDNGGEKIVFGYGDIDHCHKLNDEDGAEIVIILKPN